MRYAYNLVAGLAENRRYVKPDYVLKPGELEGNADPLPSLDELSDPAAVAAREAAKAAKLTVDAADAVERAAAKADAQVQAMLNRTPAQISTFIDAQVTDLAGARAVLKLIMRLLIHVARQSLR